MRLKILLINLNKTITTFNFLKKYFFTKDHFGGLFLFTTV